MNAKPAGTVWLSPSWPLLFLLLLPAPYAQGADKLLGTIPPAWQATNWFNSPPLELKDLRGKVVLVRWWTAPDCPYCRASAPALNNFFEQYHSRGLEVVGFYHHKSDEPLDAQRVKRWADDFGFKFPIATDPEWTTLNRWWLNSHSRGWTSVSFLIDRAGKIRHIHPGGQYVKGDRDYAALKKKIEQLLAEN
jgi:peroxiredoxin